MKQLIRRVCLWMFGLLCYLMIRDVRTICFVFMVFPIKDFLVSEITITQCFIDPAAVEGMCEPHSTSEQDAMKGRWVRVPRNLNMEGSIFSGWLVCSFCYLW
jgi:hypothetical protein